MLINLSKSEDSKELLAWHFCILHTGRSNVPRDTWLLAECCAIPSRDCVQSVVRYHRVTACRVLCDSIAWLRAECCAIPLFSAYRKLSHFPVQRREKTGCGFTIHPPRRPTPIAPSLRSCRKTRALVRTVIEFKCDENLTRVTFVKLSCSNLNLVLVHCTSPRLKI